MGQITVRRRTEGAPESKEVLHEIDLMERANPRSVINLVSDATQAHMFSALKARPDLFRMAEKELRKAVKPTATDSRLRLAFWNEYNLAQETNQAMRMASVYAGVCTRQYFEGYYLSEPRNIAWMLCPPASFIVAMEEMLSRSMDKLSDILDQDVVDEHGKVDVKLGELFLKIHLAIESRLKGAVVTRAEIRGEIKQTNLNLNADMKDAREATLANQAIRKVMQIENVAEIGERLKQLRAAEVKREREAGQEAPVIDVTQESGESHGENILGGATASDPVDRVNGQDSGGGEGSPPGEGQTPA